MTVAGCVVLYNIGTLIQPVAHFGPALSVRLIVFVGVAIAISVARKRLAVLEHSAEELEDIRAALTPAKLVDLPNVDAASVFVPSDHGVSGDFFLLTNGPDNSTIAIVGDVVSPGRPLGTLHRCDSLICRRWVSQPAPSCWELMLPWRCRPAIPRSMRAKESWPTPTAPPMSAAMERCWDSRVSPA